MSAAPEKERGETIGLLSLSLSLSLSFSLSPTKAVCPMSVVPLIYPFPTLFLYLYDQPVKATTTKLSAEKEARSQIFLSSVRVNSGKKKN